MNDRRMFLRTGMILAGAALAGIPGVATAQEPRDSDDRDRDDRDRDESGHRRGQRLSPRELEREMRAAARASRRFSADLHRGLRRRRFHGERGEEAVEEARKLDQQIHDAARKLRDREDRDEIRGNVGRCVDAARELDRMFAGGGLGAELDESWETLIGQLNVLAVHYGFRRIRVDVDERER